MSGAMEGLIVRYAAEEELPAINEIRKQVLMVHAKGMPDFFRAESWESIEEVVYQRFREEGGGVIAAVLDGEVVGFAQVEYVHRPSAYGPTRNFYHVEEFGVDEHHRRKGIATRLIEFVRRDAAERGFSRVDLDMWEFNEGALAFYESVGFRTYRRYMDCPSGE